MFQLIKRFVLEDKGQDFAEYALILGAVGVVAIAVIARYRNELQAAFSLASKPCAWREEGR